MTKGRSDASAGDCYASDLFDDDSHARVGDPEDLAAAKDAACADSLMATARREKAEDKLAHFGLDMAPCSSLMFKGAGGMMKEALAASRALAGIHGRRAEVGISEIEGDMSALIAPSKISNPGDATGISVAGA